MIIINLLSKIQLMSSIKLIALAIFIKICRYLNTIGHPAPHHLRQTIDITIAPYKYQVRFVCKQIPIECNQFVCVFFAGNDIYNTLNSGMWNYRMLDSYGKQIS